MHHKISNLKAQQFDHSAFGHTSLPQAGSGVTDTVFRFHSDFDWQQPGEFHNLSD
jgi:hypothetical protein